MNLFPSPGFWNRTAALILCPLLLSVGQIGHAAPFRDLKVTFTQPDGTPVQVIGSGDEFFATFETSDGYTVLFDHAQNAYCFARKAADGSLISTGRQIHNGNPTGLDLVKHLRVEPQHRKRQVRERWDKWEKGMQVEKRWKERKSALLQAAMAALRSPASADSAQPAPPAYPTIGTKVGLCLLIDFDDDIATVPQAEIISFCNGDNYTGYGNAGSVKKYFQDNSNGLLTYSNVVTIYIRIPNSLHPKSWYNNTSMDCGVQANLLIRDAITIMKALPSYNTEILPTFSNLTTDSGNNVIAFNVFYAGGNGNVWSFGLWPHSWALANVGPQYLSPGGKKVFRYQITNIGSSLALGTFCHENGHMLCDYPDIYDYNYDSFGGAGKFCLMNSGGHGQNPTQICAYLKRASGWATTTELDSTSSLTALLTATAGTNFNHFYRYQKPNVPTEYFLLECRYAAGRDATLPASGVAVWHIDELGDRDNQSLAYNSSHNNYEVTLVQADNLWHFQNYINSGDNYDLYHSGNTASGYTNRFSDATSPSARWWDGSSSLLDLRDFSSRATTMSFVVGSGPSAPTILTQPQSQTVYIDDPATFTVAAVGNPAPSYQWYFNSLAISNATAPSFTLTNVQPANAGTYSVVVSNALGTVTSQNAVLTAISSIPMPEVLDNTNLVWVVGGNKIWRGQAAIMHDGIDAAQSGAITHNEQSWVQTSVTGPGVLRYWWKVSSETSWDFLQFQIDGVLQSNLISGEVDWTLCTLAIEPGTHTLRWTYIKDTSVSDGLDRGWLDQVTYQAQYAPFIVSQPASQSAGIGQNVTFSVQAVGQSPLSYQWYRSGWPIAGATLSTCTLMNVQPTDAASYGVVVTNSLGLATSDPAWLTVVRMVSLTDALDLPSATWISAGHSQWLGESGLTHDSIDAAVSGTIGHGQQSWIETTLPPGPGTLTFWWKVSSEPDYDFLEFYLDGVLQLLPERISGEVNWTQQTVTIPAGNHQIKWRYTKDADVSSGADCGWVDQVSFVSNYVPLLLSNPRWLSSQRFQFDLSGTIGRGCVVYGSTNLVTWSSLTNATLPFTYTDAETNQMRIFRAMEAP